MKRIEGITDISWSEKMRKFDNDWFTTPEERLEYEQEKHSVSSMPSSYGGRCGLSNRHYLKPPRKAPSTGKHARVKRLYKRKHDFFLQVCPSYKLFKSEEKKRKEIEKLKKEKIFLQVREKQVLTGRNAV